MENKESLKKQLRYLIDEAWEEYVSLHKAEIESGYDDAMDGFDRKEAEGYAMGLESAYKLIFDEEYTNPGRDFDPYEYEENING